MFYCNLLDLKSYNNYARFERGGSNPELQYTLFIKNEYE